jgi:ubiquinone/menaquinone biosynthesis C-methylase UbiE
VLEGVDLGTEVLEIGAGPGVVTRELQRVGGRVTALEIDGGLAARLSREMGGNGVRVVRGDGSQLPFADQSFSGVVCLTMLHHVPSVDRQDALLEEACRVLRPGGVLAGSDSLMSVGMRLIHLGDTLLPVTPVGFAARLQVARFADIRVEARARSFRFLARR